MDQFGQVVADVLAWFLKGFAVCLVVNWVVSLFRRD